MDGSPTYQGIALDAETALALLEWQFEMGIDAPMLDAPLDRFDLPARSAAAMAPPSPPQAAPAVLTPEADDLDARIARAQALAEDAASLEALAAAQEGFDGLELKRGARRFCFADGVRGARVLVLGDAPGDEEDRQGRPFVGRAGQMLDRMFAAIGLARDSVDAERGLYLTTVAPWRPPGNRDLTADEIAVSLPFLARHIQLAAPDLVVLMGNAACHAGIAQQGLQRLRGQWVQAFGRPALPMCPPVYLLQTPVAKRDAWADLLLVAERLETLSV